MRPGIPSDSAWTRRMASLRRTGERRAIDSARRLRTKSASIVSPASNDQARARICDDGEYAAHARKAPSRATTETVAPLSGSPSTVSMAPEKTQGWRWRSDFSRPGFSTTRGGFIHNYSMDPIRLHDRLLVKVADITREDVDAIVNAANSSLMGGGGVDGAIHRAGGPEMLAACRRIRETMYPQGLPTGEAVITTGGKLPARHVIHAVGPIYGRHEGDEARLLGACYANSIALAARHGLATIAFPAISTGAYGYPKEEAARVSRAAIELALEQHASIREVRLVFFSEADAR